jgi:hypothetical protein
VSAVYPNGTLRPYVSGGDTGTVGEGDHRIQAYNYRLCLTADPAKRVPFGGPPAGYNGTDFDLFARYIVTDPSPRLHNYLGIASLPGNKVCRRMCMEKAVSSHSQAMLIAEGTQAAGSF